MYPSLDEAIEEVDEFTTIYICEGIYTIKKSIFKRGLIFERRDMDKKVFIIGNDGPVISIYLDQDDYVVFKKITFMHTGANVSSKFKEAAPQEPKYSKKAKSAAITEFEVTPKQDCLFFVHSGGVMLRDCVLTLKSMPKKLKSKYPCIVTLPKTFINMTSCQLYGNDANHTSACIFINSHVFISDCKFSEFNSGCIFTLAKPGNIVSI